MPGGRLTCELGCNVPPCLLCLPLQVRPVARCLAAEHSKVRAAAEQHVSQASRNVPVWHCWGTHASNPSRWFPREHLEGADCRRPAHIDGRHCCCIPGRAWLLALQGLPLGSLLMPGSLL